MISLLYGKRHLLLLPSLISCWQCCNEWHLDCSGVLHRGHLQRSVIIINLYFYRYAWLTWSSNMGGTAPGSGSTSATCLALTEVLSEENVNLFNNSALKCEHEWVVEHFDIFDITNKICSNKINTWNLCQLQSSPPCEQFLCATWGHLQVRKSSQSVHWWSHQIQICNIFTYILHLKS